MKKIMSFTLAIALLVLVPTSCGKAEISSMAKSTKESTTKVIDQNTKTQPKKVDTAKKLVNLDGVFKPVPQLGLFHVAPNINLDEFDKVVKYDWVTCFILEGSEIRSLKYALKKIKEQKKTAFVYMNIALTEYRQLKPNWKEGYDKVVAAAKEVGCGNETFLGWFYDEPFLNSFTEEAFITATKYSYEKYKKRSFAVYSTPEFDKSIVDIPQFKTRPVINETNLQYVTDVAYDYYQIWGEKQKQANSSFKKALSKRAGKIINWYIPPMGLMNAEWKEEESEKNCIEVFENYFNFIKNEKVFGGVFFYTWEGIEENGFVHGNGKQYMTPEENGVAQWPNLYKKITSFGKDLRKGKSINQITLSK